MSVQALVRPRVLAPLIAAALLSAGCGGNDGKTDSKAPATTRASSSATPQATGAPVPAAAGDIAAVDYPGVQHQHYRYGPLLIRPGQNPIVFRPTSQKPRETGVITRFHPDLI